MNSKYIITLNGFTFALLYWTMACLFYLATNLLTGWWMLTWAVLAAAGFWFEDMKDRFRSSQKD